MQPHGMNSRFAMLVCGLVMGIAISTYWPHEPLKADASGLEKIALCTAPTINNQCDAVFVLDSVTGRIVGACYNPTTRNFSNVWKASVAADFDVVENAQYVMVSGYIRTIGGTGGTPAQSAIYVAELTSGKVGMYGFVMSNGNQAASGELVKIAGFPFRDGK